MSNKISSTRLIANCVHTQTQNYKQGKVPLLCRLNIIMQLNFDKTPFGAVIFIVVVVLSATANYVANSFLDVILAEMSYRVSANGLDPLRASNFKIRIASNNFLNHDLEVVFNFGQIRGLSGIARKGNCSYSKCHNQMSLACNLTFASVKINMTDVDVFGDTLSSKKHSIRTLTSVDQRRTHVAVEMDGPLFGTPNKPLIIVKQMSLKTYVYGGKLHLNHRRYEDFRNKTNQEMYSQLLAAINAPYMSLLKRVLMRHHLP